MYLYNIATAQTIKPIIKVTGFLEYPWFFGNILFSFIWPRGVSYRKLHKNHPAMWVCLL